MVDLFVDILLVIVFLAALTLLVKPVGLYIARVFQGDIRLLKPLENSIYRAAGIKDGEEMGWKQYALAVILFNLLGFIILFLILVFQDRLPLNPQHLPGFAPDLALNSAISFMTNTNWQNYSGESAASYFTQMAGLTVQNFVSAATGICVAIAFIRGIVRREVKVIGNFWVDMVRCTLYILLPVSLVLAIALMSQGVIMNFNPDVNTTLVTPYVAPDGTAITGQTLPMGPVASQESIKEFGTNGGGFMNTNSAHPFENPSTLTDILEIFFLLLISLALTYTFGYMVRDTRQGWALYVTIISIFLISLGAMYAAELNGNPIVNGLGVSGPYMEGKEVRFGIIQSALFATSTTGTSCGAVNTMHDSLTPLGGGVALFLISLGEVVPGGVGSGLYTLLAYVIIAVFVAGLMIGRTPEYLGKKIEQTEMGGAAMIVLVSGLMALLLSTFAYLLPYGVSQIANSGPHGLTEIFYAFLSQANNNGSAFAGLSGNTMFYNILGALAMLVGRFAPAVAALMIAGSMASKKHFRTIAETLPTHRLPFILWLFFIIIVIGALTFFPVYALGPFIEHLLMTQGVTF
ncbi:MAG TPA: potassium-transporting ATPase subunit KdpA [Methanocella sp.]|uniref:potassium-transporting ATPase subunit KdpA n=1 Tax=Methanocella sp. TaxID=2052833 RepID=UPI002C99CCD8|nr:potassium-transporting ATPase subunit KdpA [Methanocella sp.]HTY92207.1 potassium-transporting ATPase subunit KdpA [Methanocella sp.]